MKFLENFQISWRIDFFRIFGKNFLKDFINQNHKTFSKFIYFEIFQNKILGEFHIPWRIDFLKKIFEIISKVEYLQIIRVFPTKNICPENPTG